MRIERLDETTRKNLLEDLLKRSPNSYGTYEASVREILDEVKNRRDEAVFAYTEKFDGAALNADNIQVTEEETMTSDGINRIRFLISTNPGLPLRPVQEVASGGELSRIMLAIKSIAAKKEEIETMIFDEIDTGISGRTAQMVAQKIARIAAARQVICVTHLAQIAAMGDKNFFIEKIEKEGNTCTPSENSQGNQIDRRVKQSHVAKRLANNRKADKCCV